MTDQQSPSQAAMINAGKCGRQHPNIGVYCDQPASHIVDLATRHRNTAAGVHWGGPEGTVVTEATVVPIRPAGRLAQHVDDAELRDALYALSAAQNDAWKLITQAVEDRYPHDGEWSVLARIADPAYQLLLALKHSAANQSELASGVAAVFDGRVTE